MEEYNTTISDLSSADKLLGTELFGGILVWHALFIIGSSALVILIFLCCCISFRIPRTKQEIEADYIRKQIARKFRKQLDLIQDSEMDEMDLVRAVRIIRFELMSEEEKAAQMFQIENDNMAVEPKSETPEKSSVTSDALKKGTSEEKLMNKRTTPLGAKFVTIVNAFNILRIKKSATSNEKPRQMIV